MRRMRRGTRRVACMACVLSLVSISGCRGAEDKPDGGAKDEAAGACDSGTCDATVESVSCVPSCAGMVCGDDGCGGSCGNCSPGIKCIDGQCPLCESGLQCNDRECGEDGCGGTCGTCPADHVCSDHGKCVGPPPDPCEGLVCGAGTDGTTQCGVCPCPTCPEEAVVCIEGQCQDDPTTYDCGACAGLWWCIDDCSEGDSACAQACVNAQPLWCAQQWSAVAECYQENLWPCWDLCPEQPDDYHDCPSEAVECFEKGSLECETLKHKLFHGDLTCKDMWECLNGCPQDDPACSNECIECGDVAAQDAWYLFIVCLDDAGYFDCAERDAECSDPAWAKCQSKLDECLNMI